LPEIQKTKITYLKGVGPNRAEAFEKQGIRFLEDLFNVYPRDYIQRVSIVNLKRYENNNVLTKAVISAVQLPRKSNHPMNLLLEDPDFPGAKVHTSIWGGKLEWRTRQFRQGDKLLIWGKPVYNHYSAELMLEYRDHKKMDASDEELVRYPWIPLYILSGELRKTWIKPLALTKIIFTALKTKAHLIPEVLSESIRNENTLLNHKEAVLRLHYPLTAEDIEKARRTLAFEELFFLQLVLALRKRVLQHEPGISFEKVGERLEKLFRELLQFELTNAQKRVIKEIRADMKAPKPMNRLLQGDVGSGKTIVVIFCMLIAIENGYQCAFMAPTEILAEQHYKVLKSYFDKLGVNTVQLIGGQKKKVREQILQDIRLGKADVVVGTHALFQETVEFKQLGFLVIDEQHKFGVLQRARLREKGVNPDVLVMTATPIPRTLSLTIYGDLEVSKIDEMPPGRKPVKTLLRSEKDRDKVYEFIRSEIKKGRQAYIVYPIIEESEKLDLKAAEVHFKILKESVFKDLRVGLIHGRMFWYEIDETIEDFKNRKLDILVTTTVIEVGIDIPNATIMLIEEAQRFGLSQLHQLRGRVGRGAEQSYCILMAKEEHGGDARVRLDTLVKSSDGFEISEVDLQLRGPGEFFGVRQSGELKFSVADLSRDMKLLEKAREAAFRVIQDDPELRKPENQAIRKFFLENYKESMELVKVA